VSIEFHYSNLLPKRPPVMPRGTMRTRSCKRCAGEFSSDNAAQKYCAPCGPLAKAATQTRALARLKKRRAAKRLLEGGKS
jgi:ribosomal protein L37E